MRPERLVMEGFAPFRERTTVDFSDLELFALTGPTGAGKSSVIDAMTFALYGCVPRYGKAAVRPVVSLGRAEAKVQLDFEVEGRRYTVVRVVRLNKQGGAVQAEVRLETGDGQVLASGPDETTAAVERLVGLEIDHFTRSVVLPQGQFAAFLHDPPARQQDLIKALLDMGVLDVVRGLAGERAKAAKAAIESARALLEGLGDVTETAVEAARHRVEDLERMVETVAASEAAIDESQAVVVAHRQEAAALEERARLLEGVSIPAGIAELAESVADLDERIRLADEQLAQAREELDAAQTEAAGLPSADTLNAAAQGHERLQAAAAKVHSIDLEALERQVADARAAVDGAVAARDRAVAEHEQARSRHAAHALVAGLCAGDPCPVCEQPLPEDPGEPPAGLDETRRAVEAAEEQVSAARDRLQEAEAALAEARATRAATVEAIEDLRADLAGLPSPEELPQLLAARRAADERLEAAKAAAADRQAAVDELRRSRQELEEQEKEAWERFASLRDRLAVLEPPPAPRHDLAAAWEGLVTWAEAKRREVAEQLLEAKAAAEDAAEAVDKQRDELERMLADAGVGGAGSASARLAAALATAKAELASVEEKLEQRRNLEQTIARRREEEAVASELAKHLNANRFEAWVLSEALAALIDGANELIDDLTGGAYSLALDDRRIEVVDHRNADERRPVRSLSGGETFLVSLALALSLGEHLSNLSEKGGARLDAIFLDEGFGSLDAETLETVAAVVSELASRGRMVGVVTHVKDLAEQMPVRFEVRSGPGGSTVEKVAV
jgi:exonuclease SbcC